MADMPARGSQRKTAAAPEGLFDSPDPAVRLVGGRRVVDDQPLMSPLTKPGKPVPFKGLRQLTLEDDSTVIGCADCLESTGTRGEVLAHRRQVHGANIGGKQGGSASEGGRGVPAGMTLVDGIPVPDGDGNDRVVAARWASEEASGPHLGRTLLELADGRRLQGCADCPATCGHWAVMAKHRREVHGAMWETGRALAAVASEDVVPAAPAAAGGLPVLPAEPNPGEEVHVGEVVDGGGPPARNGAAKVGAMTLPADMRDMRLGELAEYVRQVHLWERALEQEREKTARAQADSLAWKDKALAAQRQLRHLERSIEKLFNQAGFQKVEE